MRNHGGIWRVGCGGEVVHFGGGEAHCSDGQGKTCVDREEERV